MTRKRKTSPDAQAVREILQLEWMASVVRCDRCGAVPGPEHRPAHDRWLMDVKMLNEMFNINAREGG